jgi:hypothetical protein
MHNGWPCNALTLGCVAVDVSAGNYFRDLASVIKTYPKTFSTIAAAAEKAGLADRLTKQVSCLS